MNSYKNLKFPVCDNIVKVRSELVVAVYIHDVILLSTLYPGCCDMTHTLPTVVQPPDSHTITNYIVSSLFSTRSPNNAMKHTALSQTM